MLAADTRQVYDAIHTSTARAVIAVVPEAQPYTVRLPATDAASSVEAETGV